MSIDLSNRKFIFRETLDGSGGNFNAEFASKKNSSTGLIYNQMSYYGGTGTLAFFCTGTWSSTTVYSSGTWVDDDYRSITFADGTIATDSQYEWLTALADEAPDPHLTTVEDLAIVANAIRERGWTSQQLNFPDGYAAAVKALGNTLVGGTVAWNQKIVSYRTSGYIYGLTFVNNNNKSISVSGTVDTAFTNNQCSMTGNVTFIRDGRKYLVTLNKTVSRNMGVVGYGATVISGRTGGFFTQTAASSWNASIYISAPVGTELDIDDLTIHVFDVTAMFGKDVADYLYTLESGTPGAGVAKFRELFPDDYYTYNVGELVSKTYNEWPVNSGPELRGIMTLESDEWGAFYPDLYNDGRIYRRTRKVPFIPTGAGWEYVYSSFFRWEAPSGLRNLTTLPASGSIITDAYPFGGTIDLTQEDPAVDPSILKDGYIMEGYGAGAIVLYVKDSSITSDHLNTFNTNNAGKTIIGVSNNFTYE